MFNITNQQDWLKKISVGDVWGIGRQWHKKLVQQGINTAFDLAEMNPHLLRKQFNVVLMRTAMELKGTPCAGLEEIEPKPTVFATICRNIARVFLLNWSILVMI